MADREPRICAGEPTRYHRAARETSRHVRVLDEIYFDYNKALIKCQ